MFAYNGTNRVNTYDLNVSVCTPIHTQDAEPLLRPENHLHMHGWIPTTHRGEQVIAGKNQRAA